MIRTLLKEVRQYKAASIATPLFMILEVLMEMVIPFLMASIIDFMNHDVSMAHVMTPTEKINAILARYNRREEYHI